MALFSNLTSCNRSDRRMLLSLTRPYYDASMVQVFIGIIVLLACVVLTLFILKGLNRKAK